MYLYLGPFFGSDQQPSLKHQKNSSVCALCDTKLKKRVKNIENINLAFIVKPQKKQMALKSEHELSHPLLRRY